VPSQPIASGSGANAAAAEEERYRKACDELAFAFLDDGVITRDHVYGRNGKSALATANAKALNREMASLRTSLPPGIFVRLDPARRDLLKAMIAGPPSTPCASPRTGSADQADCSRDKFGAR